MQSARRVEHAAFLSSGGVGAAGVRFGVRDKKKKTTDAPKKASVIDYSNIVWPNPLPWREYGIRAFSRLRKSRRWKPAPTPRKPSGWTASRHADAAGKRPSPLATRRALRHAVDSKNNLYIADQKWDDLHLQHRNSRHGDDQEQDPRTFRSHYRLGDG